MKRVIFVLGIMTVSLAAAAQPAGRESWNKDWNFTKDGQTRKVDLPHDWGVEQPFL